MAALSLSLALTKPPLTRNHFRLRKISSVFNTIRCSSGSNEIIVRRSANYQPPIWDYNFVQSLKTEFLGDVYRNRLDELEEDVKMMLSKTMTTVDQLELINELQRLGLAYHFEDEINRILNGIYTHNMWIKDDLYATALQFRLLRQHGYNVPPREIFLDFQDKLGNFKACLCNDIKGLLSLYEASFLLEEGEDILESAREFVGIYLNKYIDDQLNKDPYLSIMINHSLDVPLHWRVLRSEARWFIDIYEKKQGMNPILLEFAKLDFNYVQAIHQDDLKYVARWWKNTRLGANLKFARDRIMENFLWTIGVNFEPQFGYCRRMSTNVNALITVIDDIYDVYGTLDELQLFTRVVERWDLDAMEQLPNYMKICFSTLIDSINEIALDVQKDQGFYIISFLKKSWADLCKAYLLEAKWYNSGYTPSFQEYMDNGWISISAPVILVHAYFLGKNPMTNDALKCLEDYPDIIRFSSIILRLADDLGTSSDELKRGDVPKSIQCYMHETGASEAKARQHIKSIIGETWKKLNKEIVSDNSPLSKTFTGVAVNLIRMAQCMYQNGDGHGNNENTQTKDIVQSLLVQPIPIHIFSSFSRSDCVKPIEIRLEKN